MYMCRFYVLHLEGFDGKSADSMNVESDSHLSPGSPSLSRRSILGSCLWSTTAVCTYTGECAALVWAMVFYGQQTAVVYFALSVSFAVVPFLAVAVMSLLWLWECDRWPLPRNCSSKCLGSILHVLSLGFVYRYMMYIYLTVTSRSQNTVTFKADTIILRFIHVFLSTAPLMVLHLSFLARPGNTNVPTALIVALITCSLSLLHTVLSFATMNHIGDSQRCKTMAAGMVLSSWYLCVVVSKIVALTCFVTVQGAFVFVAIGAHWLASLAMLLFSNADLCTKHAQSRSFKTWCQEIPFYCMTAFVYTFVCFNQKQPCMYFQLVVHHILSILENSVMIALFFVDKKHVWYAPVSMSLVVGLYITGILVLLVYYIVLQPVRTTHWAWVGIPKYCCEGSSHRPSSSRSTDKQHQYNEANPKVGGARACIDHELQLQMPTSHSSCSAFHSDASGSDLSDSHAIQPGPSPSDLSSSAPFKLSGPDSSPALETPRENTGEADIASPFKVPGSKNESKDASSHVIPANSNNRLSIKLHITAPESTKQLPVTHTPKTIVPSRVYNGPFMTSIRPPSSTFKLDQSLGSPDMQQEANPRFSSLTASESNNPSTLVAPNRLQQLQDRAGKYSPYLTSHQQSCGPSAVGCLSKGSGTPCMFQTTKFFRSEGHPRHLQAKHRQGGLGNGHCIPEVINGLNQSSETDHRQQVKGETLHGQNHVSEHISCAGRSKPNVHTTTSLHLSKKVQNISDKQPLCGQRFDIASHCVRPHLSHQDLVVDHTARTCNSEPSPSAQINEYINYTRPTPLSTTSCTQKGSIKANVQVSHRDTRMSVTQPARNTILHPPRSFHKPRLPVSQHCKCIKQSSDGYSDIDMPMWFEDIATSIVDGAPVLLQIPLPNASTSEV